MRDAELVHVMRSYLAPCLDVLFDGGVRPPVSLDLDDLDSAVQHQLGHAEEARRFERLERYYTSRADHVFTASPEDADVVRRNYGGCSRDRGGQCRASARCEERGAPSTICCSSATSPTRRTSMPCAGYARRSDLIWDRR